MLSFSLSLSLSPSLSLCDMRRQSVSLLFTLKFVCLFCGFGCSFLLFSLNFFSWVFFLAQVVEFFCIFGLMKYFVAPFLHLLY
jgi:hypothetical protein